MLGVGQTIVTQPEEAFLKSEWSDHYSYIFSTPLLQNALLDGDGAVEDAPFLGLSVWDCRGVKKRG